MFKPSPWRSRLSRYSGKLTQSQRIPACIDSIGIASMRHIISIAAARSSGLTGAKPKPHWPMVSEVMPCHPESVQ